MVLEVELLHHILHYRLSSANVNGTTTRGGRFEMQLHYRQQLALSTTAISSPIIGTFRNTNALSTAPIRGRHCDVQFKTVLLDLKIPRFIIPGTPQFAFVIISKFPPGVDFVNPRSIEWMFQSTSRLNAFPPYYISHFAR